MFPRNAGEGSNVYGPMSQEWKSKESPAFCARGVVYIRDYILCCIFSVRSKHACMQGLWVVRENTL